MNKPSAVRSVERPLTVEKAKAKERIETFPKSVRLIFSFIACSAFGLVIGIQVGEYLGLKFVYPGIDTISWSPSDVFVRRIILFC